MLFACTLPHSCWRKRKQSFPSFIVICFARTEYMRRPTTATTTGRSAVNLLCCLKNFLHCAVRNEWIEKNRFRYCKLKIDKTNVKVLLMKAELDLLPGWRSSKSFITEKIERAFY